MLGGAVRPTSKALGAFKRVVWWFGRAVGAFGRMVGTLGRMVRPIRTAVGTLGMAVGTLGRTVGTLGKACATLGSPNRPMIEAVGASLHLAPVTGQSPNSREASTARRSRSTGISPNNAFHV
jgi:hypothetical protein